MDIDAGVNLVYPFVMRFSRGHKRADGFCFWSYTSWGGEWWMDEKEFKTKHVLSRQINKERYKLKMSQLIKNDKLKRGTTNGNGLVFWGYHPTAPNCELWLTPQKFEEKKKWKAEHNKKWMSENKERANFLKRRWELENPEKHKNSQIAIKINRRARKKANGGSVTKDEIKGLKLKSNSVCYYCKQKKRLSIDHVIPLKLGGRNEISNMVMACINCNSQKQAKDPIVYAKEIGLLLI